MRTTQPKVSYANDTQTGVKQSQPWQQPTRIRRDEPGTTPEHFIEGWTRPTQQLAIEGKCTPVPFSDGPE